MQENQFIVVVNHEEQYSIWDASHPIPAGWQPCGAAASREACLEYIRNHWTDMTPASLRHAMQTQ